MQRQMKLSVTSVRTGHSRSRGLVAGLGTVSGSSAKPGRKVAKQRRSAALILGCGAASSAVQGGDADGDSVEETVTGLSTFAGGRAKPGRKATAICSFYAGLLGCQHP